MPYTPPRSACFRPDDYKDLRLFADRTEDLADLVSTLDSYLIPESPNDAHLLVRGQRGVGKSMLVRKALDLVKEKRAVLVAEVDCAVIGVGTDSVMRTLAKNLAKEAIENALDDKLRAEANLLDRLANSTKLKAREVRMWSEQLKLGAATTFKLADTVSFEFGMTRLAGKSREIEESSERVIDAAFLQQMISDFLIDCAYVDQKALLFVDNLDQNGYPEHREDVDRVTDVVRFLAGLRDGVVVMTLRTEFVSGDLLKVCPSNVDVPPMDAAGLMDVARVRMRYSGAQQRTALDNARFPQIVEALSGWTGNPWGFLSWLHHLDYERKVDPTEATPTVLLEALRLFAKLRYPGIRDSAVRKIADAFLDTPNDPCDLEELEKAGIDEALLKNAVTYGVLIPDWLLEPHGYYLPPQLHFLAH